MSACLISGLFTIGIIFALSGFIIKAVFKSSRIAFYFGVVIYLVGMGLVSPSLFALISIPFGILLCLLVPVVSYAECIYYEQVNGSR
ncbi:MAG: hypothetical protein KAS32_06865 [Candidatus Peribacteraceae bacterium]|nr:hypothetical protein [Candidatus Peribacteraceae bacterium]